MGVTYAGPVVSERLELLAALLEEKPVSWTGTTRPPLEGVELFPKAQGGLTLWVGVGGTPESVVRAASYGLPLVVAVIGGSPEGFAPLVELYHRALDHYGHPARPVSMHSPGHVAATDEQAREQMFPHQAESFTRIGRERGWAPYTREQFEASATPTGSLFVGSPETVAQRSRGRCGRLACRGSSSSTPSARGRTTSAWSRSGCTAPRSSRECASCSACSPPTSSPRPEGSRRRLDA